MVIIYPVVDHVKEPRSTWQISVSTQLTSRPADDLVDLVNSQPILPTCETIRALNLASL